MKGGTQGVNIFWRLFINYVRVVRPRMTKLGMVIQMARKRVSKESATLLPNGRGPSVPKNFRTPLHMSKRFDQRPWASEAGVCRGSDTPTIYVGDIDMYIPLENLIPIHANCMQHVLRCWERQSDGPEYKKTPRWPGLCPGPR